MIRATTLLAATSLAGIAASLWLYLANRALRCELADRAVVAPVAAVAPPTPAPRTADVWLDAKPPRAATSATPPPSLPEEPKGLDRRARRTEEFATRFGRRDGETEDEYRARIAPLIKLGLAVPRERLAEMRRAAEAQAKVTPAQSAQLDKAFAKVYDDVVDYTNKAIADGQLSPYERNVAGWLDFAGGLGGILTTANGQIGKILEPSQIKAMYDSGFEWGEYLGVSAPWENLTPPPPRRP